MELFVRRNRLPQLPLDPHMLGVAVEAHFHFGRDGRHIHQQLEVARRLRSQNQVMAVEIVCDVLDELLS
jgi:hypothetical protein